MPDSWLELYRTSPCVPVDYNTVESAFAAVTREDGSQHNTVRILLHPAKYILREPLVVRSRGSVQLTIESLVASPRILNRSTSSLIGTSAAASSFQGSGCSSLSGGRRLSPTKQLSKRLGSMSRNLLRSCLSVSAATDGGAPLDASAILASQGEHQHDTTLNYRDGEVPEGGCSGAHQLDDHQPRRAGLVFRTRKTNKPLIHVQKGQLNLINLDLVHYSVGTDIWNGNTAVQVQPQFSMEGEILPNISPDRPPIAVLTNVDITSQSGRGVVSIDGGNAIVKQCRIHHCAATGIYVGGPGSEATIEQSDIIHNGNGNPLSPRGIARGHSGIYVEQGYAHVMDSNVSNNSLTGISAISVENAVLHVENSDIIENGTLQLEFPPEGSRSYRRSINRNNVTRQRGNGRLRSGLHLDGVNGRSGTASPMRNRNEPQSPRNGASRSVDNNP